MVPSSRAPAPQIATTAATTATPAPRGPRIEVRGPWTITFPDGVAQPRTRDAPTSWDADEDTRFFSGVADLRRLVHVERGAARIDESDARVRTGKSAGAGRQGPGCGPGSTRRSAMRRSSRSTASAPVGVVSAVRLDISAFVRPGTNTVSIRVGNTALNHMAGRPLPDYRLLNLRYGERFQAQGMELIRPLPSGLVGPVALEVTPPRSR